MLSMTPCLWRALLSYLPPCSRRKPSRYSLSRKASVPPGRVTDRAPARLPLARQVVRSEPRRYSCRKPASKLSPAPTGSTAVIFNAGLAKRSVPRCASAPSRAQLCDDERNHLRQALDRTAVSCHRPRDPGGFAHLGRNTSTYFSKSLQAAVPTIFAGRRWYRARWSGRRLLPGETVLARPAAGRAAGRATTDESVGNPEENRSRDPLEKAPRWFRRRSRYCASRCAAE